MAQEELLELIDRAAKDDVRQLNLSGTGLTALPPEIGMLTNLEMLLLWENQLTALPPEVGRLTNLEWLDLAGNQLTALPPDIGNLTSLRRLILQNNQLTTLPSEIGQLRNLQILELSSNQLTALPPVMGNLTNLKWLGLALNQIQEIPPEILEKKSEPSVILNYYFQHIKGDVRRLNEAKMVLVGQPAVGKTSLVKRLLHNTFDSHQDTTRGIHIDEWKLPMGEEEIRVNVWDFGGQEIMHATHQFFLTERTLYLLVLDCRLDEPQNRIEYWLKIIQSFARDSPIIVVGNKCDQQPLDIDEQGLRMKYPTIRGICQTSCPDESQGVDDLKEGIKKQIHEMPHVHDAFLTTWFDVKRRLETMHENYIRYDQYVQICEEHDVTEPESQNTLIGFLNDLGIALHYGDHPLLSDRNVLKPEWLTKGVYSILTADELKENSAKLHWNMLPCLLRPPEHYPAETHGFFAGMMEKFELCFAFEGTNYQEFLVPDVLPKQAVDTGDWEDALRFEYHYEVLPQSIFSRFMVRMHRYVKDAVCWRTGVLLADERNEALVKADLEDKKIAIAVRGRPNTRRDFLSQIRGHLNTIHTTIAAIKATGKIPIPGHSGVLLDLDIALNLEARGIVDYPLGGPDGRIIDISIPDILGLVIPKEVWNNPEMAEVLAVMKQIMEVLRRSEQARQDSSGVVQSRLDQILSEERVTQLGINEIHEIVAAIKAQDPANFNTVRQDLKSLGLNYVAGIAANTNWQPIFDAILRLGQPG